jgi:transcription antitermination factor NusG
MPVLDYETSIYPDCLLDNFDETALDRRWWAVYSKARQEKALARELLAYQVPFFLPLISKNVIYRGRRIESQLPLFTGYLFLCASDDERLRTWATNRVSQLLPVRDPLVLVRDLRQIRNLLECGAPLALENHLQPGRRVRIHSGPFMGLEGTVEARRGGYRLIVGVHFLQRGVSLNLDDAVVEPV